MDLQTYLKNYPWNPDWETRGKRVHYFFTIPLRVSREEIWPYLSDTSALNKRLKLPPMAFSEEKGRRIGRGKLLGMTQIWEEVPWEWEYGRFIRNQRIYSKGPLRYGLGDFHLVEQDGTLVYLVYFGFLGRYPGMSILLSLARGSFIRNYRKTVKRMEKEILEARIQSQEPESSGSAVPLFRFSESVNSLGKNQRILLKDFQNKLKQEESLDSRVVEQFIHYLTQAPDDHLLRIRPRGLANNLRIEVRKLILVMLHATRIGLLQLYWDVICPHCKGTRKRAEHLWDVDQSAHCDVCQIDFDTTSIHALEVSFRISPSIRTIEEVMYCSAEPAKKPHIQFQKTLGPGETRRIKLSYPEGRYRIRIQGDKNYGLMDITPEGESGLSSWSGEAFDKPILCEYGAPLELENRYENPRAFIIEKNEEDQFALRPGDLFNIQGFRDLFAEEALSTDLSIDVGVQNLLFVDVVQSSKFYSEKGDSGAFHYIREYFRISHDIAEKYYGAIIKTMGDAVMMSFRQPIHAFLAAAAYMDRFDGSDDKSPLRLRITLNRGPCLAVKLNSGIDYFGQSVNTLAKLQKFAGPGDVVASESYMTHRLIQAWFRQKGWNPGKVVKEFLPGIGDVEFRKLRPRGIRKNETINNPL